MRDQRKEIQHSHYCPTQLAYDQEDGAKSGASKRHVHGGAPLSDASGLSSHVILVRDLSQYIPQVESLLVDEI